MNCKRLLLILVSSVFVISVFAQNSSNNTNDQIQPDDPILARLDSLDVLNFFQKHTFTDDVKKLNIYNYEKGFVPTFSNEVYEQRMKALDKKSPFDLVYNPAVQSYINLYAQRYRGTAAKMLGMAELYFPIFEEILDKHKMPLELKYLAIVESALNPTIKSRVGATGLWQFMYGTAKMYGLEINSYIDERCDPYKATETACKYLKYLYKYYGNDWSLALAAYNAGPGNINKAIRRANGEKDYWKLRAYMPKETGGYVPAFIAVNYIMNYYREHNIYPHKPKYYYYELDTVIIKQHVSFRQIAQVVNMSVEELRVLNPIYLLDEIPATEKGLHLFLPKTKIGDFITNEKLIYRYQVKEDSLLADNTKGITADSTNKSTTNTSPTNADAKTIVHKVEKGEYLASIARKYGVTITDIKTWNNLSSDNLEIGQTLKITPVIQPASSSGYKYHTIKQGDTLWSLAQKYGTTVEKLRDWNNLHNRSITIGMKIIVSKN